MQNICGCLVQAVPAQVPSVIEAISAIQGCEVHAFELGKIIVTAEDTDQRKASDQIMEMHQIPGVLSVTLTFHHFDDAGPEMAPLTAH